MSIIITVKSNYKFKIEDNFKDAFNQVSKTLDKVAKKVSNLSPKQRIMGIGTASLIALGGGAAGIYQLTKSPEIGIESTTTIIQAEINKVAAELAKTQDTKQRQKLQNRIDELAELRADRTDIVEACDTKGKTCIPNLIAAYREVNKADVQSLDQLIKQNPEKFTKRTHYKEIKNPKGESVPIYISEAHKELIKDVLDLIKNKKITFPANYSVKSQKEKDTYGVESESARHIQFIEDGKVPIQVLFTMKELAKHFTSFEVASMYRSFSIGDFKGKISMHPIAALDVVSVTFIGSEGKPININAGDASSKSKNGAAIYVGDLLAEVVRQTGATYQLITSDNVKESLEDHDGYSTKVNDPTSGKTFVSARTDHEDHWHWSFNYRGQGFTLAMTREELAEYSAKVKKGNSKNYNNLVDFLSKNNIPTINDKPGEKTVNIKPTENVPSIESAPISTKIDRTTKAFETYMKNGSDLSYPGFIEEVEAMSARLGMDPNVLLSVFAFESGIDHKRKNPTSSATGFIQLMDYTAKEYGLTTAQLKAMTPLEQLKIVEKYYTRWAKISKVENVYNIPENVYAAVAAPASLRHSLDRPVYRKGGKNYAANPAWDVDNDGIVTKGEFLRAIMNNKSAKGFLPKNRGVTMQAPNIKN